MREEEKKTREEERKGEKEKIEKIEKDKMMTEGEEEEGGE